MDRSKDLNLRRGQRLESSVYGCKREDGQDFTGS